jgi:hypothetical protein
MIMTERIDFLINKIHSNRIWDDQPVFCFTSDIDWASEDVMEEYFSIVNKLDLKITLFVTHHSVEIEKNFKEGRLERGLHPNFMNGSSHGDSFREIANTCRAFAPEAYGFRSHRAFDLTDITHLMHNEHNFKYVSHQITVFQPSIKPILHESGLINFPVYFEDGTHLYNKLDLSFNRYKELFKKPGIKIISFHPMNFVFNSPNIPFMRSLKDNLTRKEYNNISKELIVKHRNQNSGIRDTVLEIIEFVKKGNLQIMSMNELYKHLIV